MKLLVWKQTFWPGLARNICMREKRTPQEVVTRNPSYLCVAKSKSLQSYSTLCDPWTIAHQAPLSMGFSRQEYWSGLPCPPPMNFPTQGCVSYIADIFFTAEPPDLNSKFHDGKFFPLPVCLLNCFIPIRLYGTLWIAVCQAPLSMGFSRQEHWSELPCLPPGDLPDPRIEPLTE